jgi:type II secretory pathway component GspD/PulD (secretin)
MRAACAAALTLVLSGGLLPQAARADAENSSGATVDVAVVNADLGAVLNSLQRQSGLQIVIEGDQSKFHRVTANLVGRPINTVLKYVCESAGARVTKGSDGVYIVRPDDDATPTDDTATASVKPAAPVMSENDTSSDSEPKMWKKIVLQYVSPNFILKMLNETDGYRDTDPYKELGSQPPPLSVGQTKHSANPVVQEILPQAGNDQAQDNGNGQGGQQTQPSVPLGNGNGGPGMTNMANRAVTTDQGGIAQQFPGFPGGGGGGFQQGGGNGFQGGAGGGLNGQRGGVQQRATLRPDGIDQIIADQNTNSLIVRGDAQGIQELQNLIGFFDVPAKQVDIKIEFVTAEVGLINQFGITWDLIPLPNMDINFSGTSPSTAAGNGATFLTYAQGNLVASLAAELSTTKEKLIQTPDITTTNNAPAEIEYEEEIPYETTTTIAQGSGNAVSGTQVQFLDIATGLEVIPRVNGDNSVTMTLEPQVSSPGVPTFTGGPPPVNTQQIETIRTVASGETMVLGGLVQKTITNVEQKVPFLGDLPFIGGLFRTRNDNVSDQELLIFVTPTVLPDLSSYAHSNAVTTFPAAGGTLGGGAGAVGVAP